MQVYLLNDHNSHGIYTHGHPPGPPQRMFTHSNHPGSSQHQQPRIVVDVEKSNPVRPRSNSKRKRNEDGTYSEVVHNAVFDK